MLTGNGAGVTCAGAAQQNETISKPASVRMGAS
jgi:hypothetical protein